MINSMFNFTMKKKIVTAFSDSRALFSGVIVSYLGVEASFSFIAILAL